MEVEAPSRQAVATTLGTAQAVWDALVDAVAARHGPVTSEWKPSKSDFGWMCVLRRRKRTVIYLTPEEGTVRAAIVLGERAANQALVSALPDDIKGRIREARHYAEGRGIRLPIRSTEELPAVMDLIALKMAK